MEVLKTSQEIVHEGWLIKSPPTKLWRAVIILLCVFFFFFYYTCIYPYHAIRVKLITHILLSFTPQRWRKRWFALRHSGELPGQYFLEYYTDKRCRKLKGHIDLDQCEQVIIANHLYRKYEYSL